MVAPGGGGPQRRRLSGGSAPAVGAAWPCGRQGHALRPRQVAREAPLSAARQRVYELLTGDDEGRICRDIPEAACDEQPGNFVKHVVSLIATKTGDGLADPKLVLSWLLAALGAPAATIGLLVPVREAGALLPQLFIAGGIRALPRRKWVWAAGSLVQGLAVAAMAGAALLLDGAAAGWTILVLLAVFAVARSACSVSFKDVLGKTISKSTRGTVGGTAATAAAILVLSFGLLLSTGLLARRVGVVAGALVVAGGLWLLAAAVHATVPEEPGATEGGGNAFSRAREQLRLLWTDRQLGRFIATRGLLLATALAPPYLLALGGRGGGRELGELGPFVIASSLAAIVSTYVWGRLSDLSSRKVLILSASLAAAALAAAGAVGALAERAPGGYWLPGLLFVLMIAYQGVRLGRSTHIVDMADPEQRATYTALANTVIGVLLVAGGVFGLVAERAGEAAVLAIFALMCAGAAATAAGLSEVQADA